MLRRTLLAALALSIASALSALPVQSPAQAKLYTRVADGLVRAVIRVELPGNWHIYHRELGHPKAVGQPTTVSFNGEGIEWGEVRFPEPVRLDQSLVGGEGTFILAHEHQLVLYAVGRLAPGASTDGLEVKLKGLVCDDVQGCVPYKPTLKSQGPGDDALFAAFPADLVAAAQGGTAEPSPADESASPAVFAPVLTPKAQPEKPGTDLRKGAHADATLYTRVEGNEVRAALEIVLDEGWHLYHTADDLGQDPIGIPTTLTLRGEGITWERARFPAPMRLDQSDVNGPGAFIHAHEGTFVVYARGTLAPGASGEGRAAEIAGQVCADSCVNYSETAFDRGRGPDELWSGWSAALAAPAPSEPGPQGETEPEGLLRFLLLAVAGGLLTLVMPCTYPMIPITISFFTKQADKRGSNAVALALAYGAGIVLIFVLVGVLFGALIKPFAAHPVTNLVFAGAFLYFALVLFGVVNLEPPRFLMNFAGSASTKGGYLGVFLMGATLVITSFTCTAPFVGSLLSIGATDGSAGRVALGMAVFGLTMAVPFALLSLLPARIKAMPRSGEWMNTFKVTLGFVEIAAALKFLSNTDLVWHWGWLSRELFLFLWVAIFVVAALYLFGLIPLKGPTQGIAPARMTAGLAFALFAAYCWTGATGSRMDAIMTALVPPYTNRPTGSGGAEEPVHAIVVDDYEAARARAIAEKKLLLVNFTGWTCVNCRLNEENVFPAPEVRELLTRGFVEARLHTDGDRGEELSAFQEKIAHSIATPLYLVFDPTTERSLIDPVGGTQSVAGFRSFLARALESGGT